VSAVVGLVAVLVLLGFMLAPVAQGMRPMLEEGANVAKPSDLAFLLFATMAVVSAGGVAFSRNIIYSALALLGTLLSTGALYIFLDADYVAVTQLLIYIGGVLVLILFAVMLTSRITEVNVSNSSFGLFGGFLLFVAAAPVLLAVAVITPWNAVQPAALAPTTQAIGDAFLTRWLLPFEVASLVLLSTLVGSVVIARKEIKAD
jgi:NAD(P)H-quinone oxidoreductase subunit 6